MFNDARLESFPSLGTCWKILVEDLVGRRTGEQLALILVLEGCPLHNFICGEQLYQVSVSCDQCIEYFHGN